MLRLSSPSRPSPDVILLVTVAELVGLGDDPRLHRRLAEPKVTQRSEREPPLLKKMDKEFRIEERFINLSIIHAIV